MAVDKPPERGLPGGCSVAHPQQGPTVTLALALVRVVSGAVSGCNTEATQSESDTKRDVAEPAPRAVSSMGFEETFPRAFVR
jgi:hypothetical protein